MNDKRKFERFEINVPVRIEMLNDKGQWERFDLETHNLSAGGIFIKITRPLPEGSQVKAEVILSFEELKTPANPNGILTIAATGHTLRSGPKGFAISFNEDYHMSASPDFISKEKNK